MSAPRLLAPTTISGGVPTAGAGTLNTIALWTPDGNTLGNSLLTQSGNIVTNASGAIRAAGTTQTSPAFTRHDTTTSGIYFPATNEIGFTISNQHAMFISSGRLVGIGTTSPASALHVRNNTAGITLDSTLGGGRQYQLNPLRTGLSNAGFEIRDVTASAAVISIDATQQVGIGTASPIGTLDVRATNSTIVCSNSATRYGYQVWNDAASEYRVGTGGSFPFVFLTANVERMRFGAGGTQAQSQAAIGTSSVTGYAALTLVADVDVYGVRVGRGAGAQATNTAVGASALNANTSGTANTAIGAQSGQSVTTGANNVFVGYVAGSGVTTGTSNTMIGYATASGGTTTGTDNTLVGAIAGNQITTGSNNVCVGSNAGQTQNSASDNTYIGKNSGYFQTGSNNTALGRSSLLGTTGSSGAQNTAIGHGSLVALTSGSNNTALGLDAGNNITTGSSNICLGRAAATAAAADSNQLVVGSAAQYVATNGGATTYYATAGASLGYIQVRLNGANVKIQVFAP